ncbi:zf-HC2 domain-containing protein [bacterium]|nr:zf-HC2 domain-containing protein [bacterium]
MDCEDLIRYLSDYIDGDLDETLAAAAREHLATCRNCSVVLDTTQRTIALYRLNGRRQSLSADRHATLYTEIAAAFARRDEQT